MKPEEINEIQRQSFERLIAGKDHGVQVRHSRPDDKPGLGRWWGDWYDAGENNDGTAYCRWECIDETEYRIRPETVNVFGKELPLGKFIVSVTNGNDTSLNDAIVWDNFIRDFLCDCIERKYAQKPNQPEDGLPRPHEAYVFCDFEGAPHVCIKNLGNRGNMEKWFEFLDRGLKEGFAKPKKVTAEELVTYLVCSTTHSFEDRAQKIIDLFEGKGE